MSRSKTSRYIYKNYDDPDMIIDSLCEELLGEICISIIIDDDCPRHLVQKYLATFITGKYEIIKCNNGYKIYL